MQVPLVQDNSVYDFQVTAFSDLTIYAACMSSFPLFDFLILTINPYFSFHVPEFVELKADLTLDRLTCPFQLKLNLILSANSTSLFISHALIYVPPIN